jgi:cytochrome d ubiquinol oxidase subunit II
LVGLNAFLLQGATFAAVKTDSEVQKRARTIIGRIWPIFPILFLAFLILGLAGIPNIITRFPLWISVLVVFITWWLIRHFSRQNKDKTAFLMSSLQFAGLWGVVGSMLFPYLVRANNQPEFALTIHNSSSTELTLTVMLIIAVLGMPLVLLYTRFIFKTFKGKVQ